MLTLLRHIFAWILLTTIALGLLGVTIVGATVIVIYGVVSDFFRRLKQY